MGGVNFLDNDDMGYDYSNDVEQLYTSYNYNFYFYHYLDKEQGLRFIYGKKGRDVLPFLFNMRSALQGSPAWTEPFLDDGWLHTVDNAYHFLDLIIQACIKSPNNKWHGD